ncbi:MAG: tRNA uridine-5-carboxymethylaminomethyl(34) synthesis GTPase MnmE [Gemmatimonadaceae bacterium]
MATSTAPGRGAIAVVRLSGARAGAIARRIATPFPSQPRVATLATIRGVGGDGFRSEGVGGSGHGADGPGADGPVIDHGIVTWYAAPASYTGEDVVELAVHGGALVSALVVEACVTAGARPALAGEFTERAVLNGKMDLVQAEAVADLIDARTRSAHRAAVRQLDGALSKRLTAMREALLQVDALIAYDIDFPAEDDGPVSRVRVLAACDDAIEQVERLLATLPAAALGRDGALVVLAGPPNSGKSSLLNALVGEARVIVSELPGTTRDAVEVLVDDTPYPLRLVDTAGLRESGDTLERMGIEVSERYLAQAQVVLACAETASALEATMAAVRRLTAGSVIGVATKCDLWAFSPRRSRRKNLRATEDYKIFGELLVSSVTGEGLDELRGVIRQALAEHVAPPSEEWPLITRARHSAALRRAGEELRAFRGAWEAGNLPAPVAATHLRAAVTALEEMIGAVDVEDVLERVFRTFCVGK